MRPSTSDIGAPDLEALPAELPLRSATPTSWAELAAANLDLFLADHAVCEQQAALFGLSLVGHYPDDDELVERMSALAAEEVSHLRRVHALLRRRGHTIARRRGNPWVQGLRGRVEKAQEDLLKIDRLFVGALIEARSCERFTTLLGQIHTSEPEVARLLQDLGPAEKRHWQMFYELAERETDGETLQRRWHGWLDFEAELSAKGGVEPTVHG
ncbi:MAG: tRNA 2-methylthio-N6-isopentenyl adenosine(37) hydroxylase MiaE [Thermoanaerobaculia bacterium]|nr:tRNA 2-methylthio-N6-isopentenyl adenosine(37) hydroxylase MiaE [Thermoanaerobaculia bacterium]